MDTTVTEGSEIGQSEDGAAAASSSVCEKRPVENGENGDLPVRPRKKPRCGEEMKRVAEIVLVLASMGRIRGGKSPTQAELELMAEGREKLAEMCQQFAPKDIVGRDAIGGVIEDLGLNGKLKDQRLGFRAPRLTISEKLLVAKRKMEESKKYPAASAATTPHIPQSGIAAGAEKTGFSPLTSATHTVRPLPLDKTNHASVSSGGFTTSSPYVNATFNASSNSHYTRDSYGLAQPRIKSDGSSSVHNVAPQGPVVPPVNLSLVNAPTWPMQTQSNFSARSAAENKVPNQTSVRTGDLSFRPFTAQTPQGSFSGMNQPMQGVNLVSPSGNNHAEIARTIQKFLQPRGHQNLPWNPPSREYMNKAITCQLCQVTISDVESVLICDACEKGYHLKCLQANNMKGVPKFEWHCTKCVQLCNGKPLPPKYGRVMRSMNTPKMPSNTSVVQLPVERKVGTMHSKINEQKPFVQANTGFQGPPEISNAGRNSSEPNSQSENPHPSSCAASDVPANAAPGAASNAASGTASNAAPDAASSAAPVTASNAAPDAASSAGPDAASSAAPDVASSEAQKATLIAATDTISGVSTDAKLNPSSSVTANAAVNETVNATSRATSNSAVDVSAVLQGSTAESSNPEPKVLAETSNVKETLEKDSDTEKNTSTTSPENGAKLPEIHSAPSDAPSSKSLDHDIKSDVDLSVPQEKPNSHVVDSVSDVSRQSVTDQSSQMQQLTNSFQNPNETENNSSEQPTYCKISLNDEQGVKNPGNTCEERDGICISKVEDGQQAVTQEQDAGNSEPRNDVQNHP